MLGSASVEIEIAPPACDVAMRLLFSADSGPDHKLLHPDPEGPTGIDFVVCDSTYGDTDREPVDVERRREVLSAEVRAAMPPGGAFIVPSFAVERAQEIIADLTHLIAHGALPSIPIYIDSPLARRATKVFADHWRDLEGGAEFIKGLKSHDIHFTETAEQSKALDRLRDFHIVIVARGMCEAGRIRYRLKNRIWRDEATVLRGGFQAEGTLGRILQGGARAVRIQGEEFDVRARIRSIDLYSGHADRGQLVNRVRESLPIRHAVFLVHGEEHAITALEGRLKAALDNNKIIVPSLDDCFSLTETGAEDFRERPPPRLPADKVARLDWHNEASQLFLDINDALMALPDE